MFLVLSFARPEPRQRQITVRVMVADKDTGYGIPNIAVNFSSVPLLTNEEGMISYTYKQIGNRRKSFNVSVPESTYYLGEPQKRIRSRYHIVKLQIKQSKQISATINFVDAQSNKFVHASVVIMKNNQKLGRWQAVNGTIKIYYDQAQLNEQITVQVRGTRSYNQTTAVIQLQSQQTIRVMRNPKYSVDMGFVVRNMTSRRRVKDCQIYVSVNGVQINKQVDQDGEFFIRNTESAELFRSANVTLRVNRYGQDVYTQTIRWPAISRWYTINLK